MALTVKNKIWLGTLFLFGLLLITGGVSIGYMAKLKGDARNVLQANYESLSYCHTMQQQVNLFPGNNRSAVEAFGAALQQQTSNITEAGEKLATDSLQTAFSRWKRNDTNQVNIRNINGQLQRIIYLNEQAIKRKSERAEQAAGNALTLIISLCGLIFIIAFTFIVNFPSIITNPITQLTEAIQQIAKKNYKHRIHMNNKDEFGRLAAAYNEMAERLEYFENSNLNQLMFEKSRAEAVINSLKDASIGIDKNNRILFANQQALQLLGIKAETMVGKAVEEVATRNDLFRFLIENEGSSPFKIVVDDRENYFTKEIIDVEQGGVKNKVIVLHNITSFKELDVAKTNFIATVSHELKTPLAAADFSLKLLEDERISRLTPEQKELVQSLKGDNQRMLKILSELLNLSQVEAGRIKVHLTRTVPQTIVDTAVAAVAANAREKKIEIHQNVPPDLPPVMADKDKAAWILTNLLTNAIKYSPPHSTIKIEGQPEAEYLRFSVADAGPGIDARYLPRLFDRYFQVPGSREKGTGLGLSISKEFAEAQGGKMGVTSQVGVGSLFFLLLPLAEQP